MPLNLENAAQNGHSAPQPKRPNPYPDQQKQRLEQVESATASAIASLAKAGCNTINTQVYEFDGRLTHFERKTAQAMADRLRQSPLRIQQYLMDELKLETIEKPNFGDFAEEFEVVDLTSNFLAIAPCSAAGALPL